MGGRGMSVTNVGKWMLAHAQTHLGEEEVKHEAAVGVRGALGTCARFVCKVRQGRDDGLPSASSTPPVAPSHKRAAA